jgi:hypothetical protein
MDEHRGDAALLERVRQDMDAITPPEAPPASTVMRRGRARRGLRIASGAVVALAATTVFVWTGAELAGLHHQTSPGAGAGPGSNELSARIVLPATTMPQGTSMDIKLVVDNDTGHTVTVSSCGSPFAVALANDHYTPMVAWTLCGGRFSIPPGRSTYEDVLRSSYLACAKSSVDPSIPKCTKTGDVPPLPTGTYFATLYSNVKNLAHADPVEVHVTP